jgi:NADP-dependent 3-hydroxy acid dehydrogenase YdfG
MTACTDQIAVVTGASSGVGKAIALGLAAQGATLCLMGRHRDTLEAVAARARGAAQRVLCYQTDLALDDDLQKATECLKRGLGGLTSWCTALASSLGGSLRSRLWKTWTGTTVSTCVPPTH